MKSISTATKVILAVLISIVGIGFITKAISILTTLLLIFLVGLIVYKLFIKR